jgi:hypothetical protein
MRRIRIIATAAMLGAVTPAIALQVHSERNPGSSVSIDTDSDMASFDPGTLRVFLKNPDTGTLDRQDLSGPTRSMTLSAKDPSPHAVAPPSRPAAGGPITGPVDADRAKEPGTPVFLNADFARLDAIQNDAWPGSVSRSSGGMLAFLASEGTPGDNGRVLETRSIETGGVDTQRVVSIGREQIDRFLIDGVTVPTSPVHPAFVQSRTESEDPGGVPFIDSELHFKGLPGPVLTHGDSGTMALYPLPADAMPLARPVPAMRQGGLTILAAVLMLLGLTAVRQRSGGRG